MGSLVAEIAEKLASTTGKLAIDGTLSLKEQADAESDTAGEGQIWVNTATPNELYFTTDAGDDIATTRAAVKTKWPKDNSGPVE